MPGKGAHHNTIDSVPITQSVQIDGRHLLQLVCGSRTLAALPTSLLTLGGRTRRPGCEGHLAAGAQSWDLTRMQL